MGWKNCFLGTIRREYESNFDFFNREFGGRLVAITEDRVPVGSKEPTVLYGAIIIGQTPKEVAIIGIVILVTREDYHNVTYKEITEEMGPYYYKCPKEIIDILTPISVIEERGYFSEISKQYAKNWRNKCLS